MQTAELKQPIDLSVLSSAFQQELIDFYEFLCEKQAKNETVNITKPNAQTQQVFAETDAGINLNKADSVEDLFNQLEI